MARKKKETPSMSDESLTQYPNEDAINEVVFDQPLGADDVAQPDAAAPAEPAPVDSIQSAPQVAATAAGMNTHPVDVVAEPFPELDSAEVPVALHTDGTQRTLPSQPEVMSPLPDDRQVQTVNVGDRVIVRLGTHAGREFEVHRILDSAGRDGQPIFAARNAGNDIWLVRGEFDLAPRPAESA